MKKVLVVGELNVDLILQGYSAFPTPGKEVLVDDFVMTLGSASAICAMGLARLGAPVGFLSTVVPEKWRLLYSVNPMVGVIDGFRWCILGGQHALHLPGLLLSISGVLFLVGTGIWYFRRTERSFADVI